MLSLESVSSPQGLGNMEEDWQEAVAGEDCCDIVSSGHDRAITQELKSSCVCLHEIKSVSIPVWMEEGTHKIAQLLVQELLAAHGYWRRVSFLQTCGPWYAAHAPVAGPIPMHMQVAVTGFHGLREHYVGRRCG